MKFEEEFPSLDGKTRANGNFEDTGELIIDIGDLDKHCLDKKRVAEIIEEILKEKRPEGDSEGMFMPTNVFISKLKKELKIEDVKLTFEEEFNKFIEKWCGSNFPHLIDSDENDGELFREKLRNCLDMKRVEGAIESIIILKRRDESYEQFLSRFEDTLKKELKLEGGKE